MTAVLFSGQGSQYVGMAKDLAGQREHARALFDRAEEILGYSLFEVCAEGPVERLKETRYTQPALFVHEAIIIDAVRNRLQPVAVAGHSLGEYSAMYAAGVLGFDEALSLVALRGKLMFEAGTSQPGTMAAIVGLPDETVETICSGLSGGVVVAANYNAPGQVVISGDAELVRASLDAFKSAGARMVTELPVSGAFHSPLMRPAQETLARAIHATSFRDADVDVVCNVDALAHREAGSLQDALIAQLVSPVRWTQSLETMFRSGVRDYVEIGPGKVLQGLVKRTLKDVTIRGIDTEQDLSSMEQ
ncbi:MAG: ACP S-malonyltransferase [Candidatus Kapaibacterium sp.]